VRNFKSRRQLYITYTLLQTGFLTFVQPFPCDRKSNLLGTVEGSEASSDVLLWLVGYSDFSK
jgi:hypothetical protein